MVEDYLRFILVNADILLHRHISQTPIVELQTLKVLQQISRKSARNEETKLRKLKQFYAVKAMAAKTNDSVFTAVIFLLVFAFHWQNKCLECFYAVNSINDTKHKQAFLNSLPKPLGNEIGARFSVQMTVVMKKIQYSLSCCTKTNTVLQYLPYHNSRHVNNIGKCS